MSTELMSEMMYMESYSHIWAEIATNQQNTEQEKAALDDLSNPLGKRVRV
jgi:hypothetical protein